MIFLKNILKRVPKHFWILLAIIFVGIFLRFYNFHDWLRFNADQGRDAEVVSEFLNGKTPLPLLGPKAGGTEFRLGPAFYYFQIASAKIFGDYPDKMAYPDLFSAVLCIPLLFLFLRKYFEKNSSLLMTAIFAVSSYAIYFSRFAWNPNSTPFWTMLTLYAIHEVISQKNNRKLLWSAVAGIAIGIGVQMHTTLLLFLPITAIIVFGYFAFKNIKFLKYFFIVLVVSLFLNIPQIIYEYQHHGENILAFFEGAKNKQEKISFVEKIIRSSICWVQGNVDIISGYEISDTCEFKPGKNKDDLVVFIFGMLFVFGGTILGLRYLKKESNPDKKYFLAIVFVYVATAYVMFILIAFELSMRFYLILMFLPFLLLGFWWKFIKEKIKYRPIVLMIFICLLLIFSNFYFLYKYFNELKSYAGKGGPIDIMILSDMEEFAKFIVSNSEGISRVYIDGNKEFTFKAYNSIAYLVKRSGVNLVMTEKGETLPERYFYVSREEKKKELLNDNTIEIIQYKTRGKFTILLLQEKE